MIIRNTGNIAVTFRREDNAQNMTLEPDDTADVDVETGASLLAMHCIDVRNNVIMSFEEVI